MDAQDKKPNGDVGLSLFELPELVENILKYLLKYPEMIIDVSMVSKKHYTLIRSRKMWENLGFSSTISTDEKISEQTLQILLTQIRLNNDTQKLLKLRKRIEKVQKVNDAAKADLDVQVDLDTPEIAHFISNSYLTDEAAIALLRIIGRTKLKPFTLLELVRWLEHDPPQPKERTPADCTTFIEIFKFPEDDQGLYEIEAKIVYHSNYNLEENNMKRIMSAYYKEGRISTEVKRQYLADDQKVLLFIFGSSKTKSQVTSFIKFDRSKRLIECCGELNLYASKNFDGDFHKTMNFLCEVNRSDENWGANHLVDNGIYTDWSDPDEIEANYDKYVAENVSCVRGS